LTQKIYDILTGILKVHADQWEGWLYYQYFIERSEPEYINSNIENNIDTMKLKYNSNRFGHIMIKNQYYLYDMDYRIMYKISNKTYSLISLFMANNNTNLPCTEDIKHLIKRNILIFK
jgi:hypothetical protein